MSSDYYEVLGIGRDASAEQIKRAYHRRPCRSHPDVTSDPDAREKFKQVNEAYEVLSDPQKKSIYDRGGDPAHAGLKRSAAASTPSEGSADSTAAARWASTWVTCSGPCSM